MTSAADIYYHGHMIDVVGSSPQNWTNALHGLLAVLSLCLVGLYHHHRGRSGPIAALLFVVFGPALGVALLIGWIVGARRNPTSDQLYGLSIFTFMEVMVLVGVVAALVGTLIHGYLIRDELRAFREFGPPTWFGRLRTGVGPSPALSALGLSATATLEEVEQAYRERAKEAHPDRGGTVEQFKRLQIIYEQAKRQVLRQGRSMAQGRSPASASES